MLTKDRKKYPLLVSFILVLFIVSVNLFSEEVEINIVYTNDIHDHIRPGYLGSGGVPYIAGFVNKIREENPNVLLLDAGDLTDKGDMVADLADGEILYKAVEKMKYDVMVIGNHDNDKGINRLCELKQLAPSVEFVATNYEEGLENCYKPWTVKDVGELLIGFVGIVKLGGEEKKVAKDAIPELKKAIEELKNQNCHLIIALAHLGSNTCMFLSKEIPEISIFVSGHTHEILREARISPENNAIIVQAGSYAMFAGYLKIIVDTQTKRIKDFTNQVIELKHDLITPDKEMLDWVYAEEKRICPIASEFLIDNEKNISTSQIGVLSANAIKEMSGADIAFCHPRLLIRSTLPPTKLDYNAIYLTGGSRAKELVEVTLTGKQIQQYLVDLVKNGWSRTEWAGINGEYERTFPPDKVSIKTDLIPDKKYKVILAKMEFQNRLLRSLERNGENIEEIQEGMKKCDFTFFDAVSKYVEKIRESGLSLSKYMEKMKMDVQEESEIKEDETE